MELTKHELSVVMLEKCVWQRYASMFLFSFASDTASKLCAYRQTQSHCRIVLWCTRMRTCETKKISFNKISTTRPHLLHNVQKLRTLGVWSIFKIQGLSTSLRPRRLSSMINKRHYANHASHVEGWGYCLSTLFQTLIIFLSNVG